MDVIHFLSLKIKIYYQVIVKKSKQCYYTSPKTKKKKENSKNRTTLSQKKKKKLNKEMKLTDAKRYERNLHGHTSTRICRCKLDPN